MADMSNTSETFEAVILGGLDHFSGNSNDEIRMTNQCSNDPMTNDPNKATAGVAFVSVIGSFEFDSSFEFRISNFAPGAV
jgi:hypothetical protein